MKCVTAQAAVGDWPRAIIFCGARRSVQVASPLAGLVVALARAVVDVILKAISRCLGARVEVVLVVTHVKSPTGPATAAELRADRVVASAARAGNVVLRAHFLGRSVLCLPRPPVCARVRVECVTAQAAVGDRPQAIIF